MSIQTAIMDCADMFRKGDEVVREQVGDVDVTHVFAMPHEDEIDGAVERRDMHFVTVAISKERLEVVKDEIEAWCDEHANDLVNGPSYIALGGILGSQDLALMLMAVGDVLGYWEVITPERLGLEGEAARRAAGIGYIMTTGYKGK